MRVFWDHSSRWFEIANDLSAWRARGAWAAYSLQVLKGEPRFREYDDPMTQDRQTVPTNQNLLAMVAARFEEDPQDAYWGRRLLEELRDEATVLKYATQTVSAFVAWAAHDPIWFVYAVGLTRETHCFSWPKAILLDVEAAFVLTEPSLRHLILGRLWWAAKLRRNDDPEFASRALAHFRAVDEPYRLGRFHKELGETLSVADPTMLEPLGKTVLAKTPAYGIAGVLETLMEGAVRARNWEAYERHRAAYSDLQRKGQTRPHDDCAVLDLDGIAALARGRADEVPAILAALAANGRNVEFLGTPDTLRLARALIERGEHLALCLEYLREIRSPNDAVKTLLAQAASGLGSAGIEGSAAGKRKKRPSPRRPGNRRR